MDHGYIRNLLEQQAAGTLTDEQWSELEILLNSSAYQGMVQEVFMEIVKTTSATSDKSENNWKEVVEKIVSIDRTKAEAGSGDLQVAEGYPVLPMRSVHFIRKWGWAAAVILLLGTSFYFWNTNNKKNATIDLTNLNADILPGKEGAVLTLADGSNIILDSMGNKVIARQNGADVVQRNGLLAYDQSGSGSDKMEYNTMSTPKGRQFRLLLPDGTAVWLNAASSIKYPTVFTGKERRVAISGEVYFEVVKNAAMPFKVQVNDQTEVEVLGTHFNVNAYENESSLNTTLLEGSVRVIRATDEVVLKPGQQAQIVNAHLSVQNADIAKVMAWKNGLFDFGGMRLKEAMQQLERWYDIEVVYKEGVQDVGFYGQLNRSISLVGVMKALEHTGVHFRLEGRKLIVLP